MTLQLNKLATESYAIASSKGWWEVPKNFAAVTDLMHSELAEAIEDYRNNHPVTETYYEVKGESRKPCGVPTELADYVIRIADFAGYAGINLEDATGRIPEYCTPDYPEDDFEHMLATAHFHVAQAYGIYAGRAAGPVKETYTLIQDVSDSEDPYWTGIPIELAAGVRCVLRFCELKGIDLNAVIAEKAAYNQTRSRKHGGKKI